MRSLFPLFVAGSSSLVLCLLLAPLPVKAEPPVHGRLADGRPYRIDKDGMRLSDYIAELEVTADDLRREVQALEDELDEKEKRLASCPAGKNPVRESSIGETGSGVLPTAKQSASNSQSASGAPVPNLDLLCGQRMRPLNDQIAVLEQKLSDRVSHAAPSANCPPANTSCDYQSAANPLLARVTELESQLASARTAIETAAQEKRSAEQLALKQQFRDETITRGAAAPDASEFLAAAVPDAQVPPAATAKDAPKGVEQTAAEQLTAPPSAHPSAQQPPRAALIEEEPARAVQPARRTESQEEQRTLRADLRRRLDRMQSLVSQRKSLLDSVKGRGKGISISIQPLVSKSGESLDALRVRADRVANNEESRAITRGLDEIEAVLTDDIQVLTRLSKGR